MSFAEISFLGKRKTLRFAPNQKTEHNLLLRVKGVEPFIHNTDKLRKGAGEKMAGTTGLEPAASAVTGQRSNQLNYVPGLITGTELLEGQDANLRPAVGKQ
jgi:hypothetical protein